MAGAKQEGGGQKKGHEREQSGCDSERILACLLPRLQEWQWPAQAQPARGRSWQRRGNRLHLRVRFGCVCVCV